MTRNQGVDMKRTVTAIVADRQAEISQEEMFTADIVVVNGWVIKNRHGMTHHGVIPREATA
ncbi:hypothetical protein PBI_HANSHOTFIRST_81 [Mycobacterium phage HanShotFirst]|uniref:hypothetical protein n=1 Tax=Mycobacterium phage HanShotFirst TaxID=1429904 RepID=UPI0003C9EFAD|nr:hypothetical protein PBI_HANSHOTFIRST_81 [Mycobacterium phage HanShotFirst]AHB31858.1 hypothetical protein PBI_HANSHOTFIRST_81 [Mycobacterium phage HanShotFirst]QXN72961.1 hypothetical protein SEA_SUNSHINE924_85 [Mycobacterium Phage Sunshine924]